MEPVLNQYIIGAVHEEDLDYEPLTAFLWTQNLGPGQDQSWPGLRFMARARKGG